MLDRSEPTTLGALLAALRALGTLLESQGATEHLVVVGGVAMNLRGFHLRGTADVDVIARGTPVPEGVPLLFAPEPLPPALQAGILRVARDFGLDPDWMNTVVASQWLTGMPPGLAGDLEWHRFGTLYVGVPGREAMIALKLFAALDLGPGSVHMQDLLRLRPTDQELERAAAWAATQDASEAFHAQIPQALAHVRSQLRIAE
ncbi:MAG TPA: hypothetical protein VF665_02750 [Longimicrobium sp.]|jgi:hypothetical protein|uniref:hypothetical protein n=1 Tax=Longimicrobium sp. TaxID=2029185 RepID=UPI002EDADA56